MSTTDRKERARMVLELLSFIGWHDHDDVQGGVTAEQAFRAACILLQLPAGTMMNIVRGRPEPDAER